MSGRVSLLAACFELANLADSAMPPTLAYLQANRISFTGTMSDCVGTVTLARIADHGNGRFDFDAQGFPALVCDVMGADGETAVDLIAWPVDRPGYVLTMFGRCGLLGMHHAMNPATYYMGAPLIAHLTPFKLFQAGFQGAAVVVPHIAARLLLDLPGRVAARNIDHGRELKALMESVVPAGRVVVAKQADRQVAA